MRALISLLLGFLISAGSAREAHAATRCVNQGGTGGCYGTITAALTAAADGDTILIAGAASPYLERLTISKNLTLVGDAPASTVIDGSLNGQVIRITTPVTVTLTNLTIRNGRAGPGNQPDQGGGGIHLSSGTLTLNNSVVTGNATGGDNYCCGGDGGGISVQSGTLTLNGTKVSGNATASPLDASGIGNAEGGAGGYGGGIFSDGDQITLNRSSVENNTTGDGANGGASSGTGGSGGPGGGIFCSTGTVVLNDSTVSGNVTGVGGTGHTNGISGRGGGIASWGSLGCALTIATSTVSGNSTGKGLGTIGDLGGGVWVNGVNTTATIMNSTIAYNVSYFGPGVANQNATLSTQNSLFAYNHLACGLSCLQDCYGTVTSQGYNVMMEPDCTITPTTGDQFYVRGTILGPLKDNGGPTKTHALASGSQALEKSDNATCPSTDQRGVHRPIGLRCDVGAFETEPIGDAIGDGHVDVADVFYVINFLFAGGPRPLGRANVNGDSAIDVADVFYLINFLFAGGPPPA
jgi:hypothetical protein